MESNKSKKLNFADMSINSTALLCPNPEEFFSKAYIDGIDPRHFRVLPGVKYKTNLANLNFGSTLRAEGCDLATSTSTLSAQTIQVTPLDFALSICKKDIETSFVAKQMAAGSSNWSNVQGFMNEYWSTLSMKINEEINDIAWNGNTAGVTYSADTAYMALANGWIKSISGATGASVSARTTVTRTNVVDLLGNMLGSAPARITSKKSELRYYAASNVVNSFRIASSLYNTNFGPTGELPLTFNGIPIIECPTMFAGQIVLTRSSNLVYAFDGLNDAENLIAIDKSLTTGEKVLLTTGSLKLGFAITNPNEFVAFY